MAFNDLVADGKKLAKTGFLIQSIVAMVLISATAVWATSNDVLSVAFGAACSVFPNGIFAFFAFRFAGAQRTELVAKSMVQGARFKLIVAAVIFGIAFSFFNAQPIYLFCAFAITTVSYWLTLFFFSRKAK